MEKPIGAMRPLVIAHRTCPLDAPENSIEGIRLAGRLGADAVEVDVQRTFDGVLVLHHDRTLWRVARLPLPVRLLPWSAVARLARRRRVNLPSFADALSALPDGLAMAVDIKDASAAKAVQTLVLERGMHQRAWLWSKRRSVLRQLAVAAPGMELALLRDCRTARGLRRFLDDAVECRAGAVSAHWEAVTPGFLAEAHRRRLRVYAMARSAGSQAGKLGMGLDGVVTDWPEAAMAAAAGLATDAPPRSTRARSS